MISQLNLPPELKGLTEKEVVIARKKYGPNIQQKKVKSTWWRILLEIIREPMLMLLIVISVIYFVMQQCGEA